MAPYEAGPGDFFGEQGANLIGSERGGLRFADWESGGVRLAAMRVVVGARRRSERQNRTWLSPGRGAQEELKARRRYRWAISNSTLFGQPDASAKWRRRTLLRT